MTVELYNEVRFKDILLISSLFPKVISSTKAADDFKEDQTRAKQIFDERQKVNEEFREATRDFSSYPNRYTLPLYYQDCLRLLQDEKYKNYPELFKGEWDEVKKRFTGVYDKPRIDHEDGSCYEYHVELRERPCTSRKASADNYDKCLELQKRERLRRRREKREANQKKKKRKKEL